MKVQYVAFTLSAALLASCGQASTPEKSSSNATPAARALGMPIVVLQLTELQLLIDSLKCHWTDSGQFATARVGILFHRYRPTNWQNCPPYAGKDGAISFIAILMQLG